ncbi:MAG: UDP-glucose 4-epimerase [Parcubacteria bacterium C7867-001]|nr:MAG: UDP-glucose 4-epimerase [Parcubacteria bacterium C7867-001]
MKALVTGGRGFVGGNLIAALHARDVEVEELVRVGSVPSTGKVRSHEIDITDAEAVTRLFEELRPTHVFHLAASNIRSGVTAAPEEVVRTNVLGTHAVVEAAAKIGAQCVTVGTFLEYGAQPNALTEDLRCEPPEIYSVSKLAGTLLASASGRRGASTVALRLFTPYGPGIQEKRLVREVLTKARAGLSLELTSPTVTRDFIYIDDVVALLIEAAERAGEYKGEIFNVGSGEKTSLETLANAALEITGSTSEVVWGGFGSVSYDSDRWQADMTKTFGAFSWRPKVSLKEGLERTLAWLDRK